MTAAKKPTQTLHPTPVFSAIRSILFIVPRNLTLVFSNDRFIFSASAVESRISSPIALVSCSGLGSLKITIRGRVWATYILQHTHLGAHAFQLLIVLAF